MLVNFLVRQKEIGGVTVININKCYIQDILCAYIHLRFIILSSVCVCVCRCMCV